MKRIKRLAKDLFSSDSFLVVNKKLLKLYDPNHAVLFSNLVDKYKYFESHDMLETKSEKEWFYLTYEEQGKETGLSEYQIGRCLGVLESGGVIETERRGVPAKKHYHINWGVLLDKIEELDDPRTSPLKTKGQDTKKLRDKSPKNSRTIYKDTKKGEQKKENKEKNNKKRSSDSNGEGLFGEEVQKKYSINSKERWDPSQPIDYTSFVDYFNSLYNQNRRTTQGKRENIRARLKTFSAKEIKQAWQNRLKNKWLKENGYLGNWKAAMRSDEKIDDYLNYEPAKPNKPGYLPKTKQKYPTGEIH